MPQAQKGGSRAQMCYTTFGRNAWKKDGVLPYYGKGRKEKTAGLIIQCLKAGAIGPSWAAVLCLF